MNRQFTRWLLWMFVLAAMLLGVSVLSLCSGSAAIPWNKIVSTVLNGQGTPEYSILAQIRLPRVVLGLAVGGALSVAGVILQNLFHNPLVEPYTLGISGGSGLAVALVAALRLHQWWAGLTLPLASFIGALAVVVLLYVLSVKRGFLKIHSLLLAGVMISFVCSSAIMLLMTVSRVEDMHGIIFWIMGSLQQSSWPLIWAAFGLAILGLGACYLYCLPMNALALGEEEAMHLGVDVEKTRRRLFLLASLLTSCSVAVAGIIGFVGLTIPHLMRRCLGADHRILLGSSFLCGAAFLILCDTAARTLLSPMELPVGAITGIVGGTLFIYVLSRK